MSKNYDSPTGSDTLTDFVPPTAEEVREIRKKLYKEKLGEGGPPDSLTGKCVACHGTVSMKYVRKESSKPWEGPTYGGRTQFYWQSKGLNCDTCGLKYEFIPSSVEGDERL